MPISSAVWSNLTVRGRGTGMDCWILATVTCLLPLARVGAVCARLGPPTAVGADSQADTAFVLSSSTFSPCCNCVFTSFCLPSGIGVVAWLKGQFSLHIQTVNSEKFVQPPRVLVNRSLRGMPVCAANSVIVVMLGCTALIFFTAVAIHRAGMVGLTVA